MLQCMVRALGLHAVALGSKPVVTSGLDFFPIFPDSTLPCFLNVLSGPQTGYNVIPDYPQQRFAGRLDKNHYFFGIRVW